MPWSSIPNTGWPRPTFTNPMGRDGWWPTRSPPTFICVKSGTQHRLWPEAPCCPLTEAVLKGRDCFFFSLLKAVPQEPPLDNDVFGGRAMVEGCQKVSLNENSTISIAKAENKSALLDCYYAFPLGPLTTKLFQAKSERFIDSMMND